jgi:tRNA-dihydrouridine synthase
MDAFSQDQAVMIGRGLLRNPALVREIDGGPALAPDELFPFLHEVQKGYEEEMYGEAPVLAKMKELWWYAGDLFPGADNALKKIKKAKSISEYEMAVNRLKEGLPH